MNAREHGQNIIARIDAGRLASSRLLQMLDLGLDASEIIREVAPGLSPVAVEAAAQLANLAAFDHAALSLLLAGLVPDATLAGLEIREAPARQPRSSPEASRKLGYWAARSLAPRPRSRSLTILAIAAAALSLMVNRPSSGAR